MENDLQNTIDLLNSFLNRKNIFYFVRDPERALGLSKILNNYHVVHVTQTQFLKHFREIGVKYFCLEEEDEGLENIQGGARVLFKHQKALDYINRYKKEANFAQTFKISPAFVKGAQEQGLDLLNSSVQLSRTFEEKLTQYQALAQHVVFPKTIISRFDQQSYLQLVQTLGPRFVIQFARGHTGLGTHIIETEGEFDRLKEDNLQRTVKFSSFIDGAPYTVNACVTRVGVFVGGLSFQITGDSSLGATRGATIGNDWSFRANIDNYDNVVKQVVTIGELMRKKGFRGMFGVDFIVKSNGEMVIIEVNARQTASIPMYTKTQLLNGEIPLSMLHLLEFFQLDIHQKTQDYNRKNIRPEKYSQVFLRAEDDVTVNHQVNMGIYRLLGDNAAINRYTDEVASTTISLDEDRDKSLLFQKYAAGVDYMDKQGVLVLAPSKNRLIKKGDELARVQLKQSAVGKDGKVSPWIVETLNAIKYHQL